MSFNTPIPPGVEWPPAYREPLFSSQGGIYENPSVGVGAPSNTTQSEGCCDSYAPLHDGYEPILVPSFLPAEADGPYCEYQANLEYVSNLPGAEEYYGSRSLQYPRRDVDENNNCETGSSDSMPQKYVPMGPSCVEGSFYDEQSVEGTTAILTEAPLAATLPDSRQLCPSSSPQSEVMNSYSPTIANPSQRYPKFMVSQAYQQQQQQQQQCTLTDNGSQVMFQQQRICVPQQQREWQNQPGRFYVPQESFVPPSFLRTPCPQIPSGPSPLCPQRISSPTIYHSHCHQQQYQKQPFVPAKMKRSKITKCVVYEDRNSSNQKKILKLRDPRDVSSVEVVGKTEGASTETEKAEEPDAECVAPAKKIRRRTIDERGAKKCVKISCDVECAEYSEDNSNSKRSGDDNEVCLQKESEECDEALSGEIHSSNLAATQNLEKVAKKAELTKSQPIKVVFEKRKNTLFKMCDSIDLITGAKCSVFLLDRNGVPHEYVSEGFKSFTSMPGFLEKIQQVFSSK